MTKIEALLRSVCQRSRITSLLNKDPTVRPKTRNRTIVAAPDA